MYNAAYAKLYAEQHEGLTPTKPTVQTAKPKGTQKATPPEIEAASENGEGKNIETEKAPTGRLASLLDAF